MNISAKATAVIIAGLLALVVGFYFSAEAFLEKSACRYVADNAPAVINGGSVDGLVNRMSLDAQVKFSRDSRKLFADSLGNLALLGPLRKYDAPTVETGINYQFPGEIHVSASFRQPVEFAGGQVIASGWLVFEDMAWHFSGFALFPQGQALKKFQDAQLKRALGSAFATETKLDGPDGMNSLEFDLSQLLATRDSAVTLDNMFEQAFNDDARMLDGRTMLISQEQAFRYVLAGPAWSRELDDIKAWEAQSPRSSRTAPIIEALYWEDYAWDARGGGYVNTVTVAGDQLFQQRLHKAQEVLLGARDQASANPLWYSVYLSVAKSMGDRRLIQDIFAEGQQRFPAFDGLYFVEVSVLMPRWYGSYDAEDRMIREAVAATRAREGEMMYAELYARLYYLEDENFELFRDSLAQWPLMKQGFDDMLNRYPRSNWLINEYAAFACMAGDKYTFQAMRSRLGDRINTEAWPGNHSPDLCEHMLGGG